MTRIDLHTHSHHSDGTLAPAALVDLAAAREVGALALTDHDTLAGCAEARAACATRGIAFISGVELTAQWREREIHVVGLQVEADEPALARHCAQLIALRRTRIAAIGARLTAAGLPGDALAQVALAATAPTRMHVARALHAQQHSASTQAAFDRWLRRGRPAYVAADWPALETVVQRIVEAGGIAVLAHAHRYRLGGQALRELIAAFKGAGGRGLEVSLAGMSLGDADRMANLARRFELAASIGSDFHEPGLPWRPVGRWLKLPDQLIPITAHLQLSDGR